MTQTFYGPWAIEVAGVDADFGERFVIAGSAASDNAYEATVGLRVDVAGEAWTLDLQWNDNAGSGWQSSSVRRTAEFRIEDGLLVTLGADDNIDAARDHDYDDVVVVCRCLDAQIDPPRGDPPLDFTINQDQLRPPKDDRRIPQPGEPGSPEIGGGRDL